MTPADAYFGRAEFIIQLRERIKRQTIEHRRLHVVSLPTLLALPLTTPSRGFSSKT